MIYVISLDWFQYHCRAPLGFRLQLKERLQGPRRGTKGVFPFYEVCAPEEFHPIYRHSFTLKLNSFPICHVHFQPKSSALNPRTASVKVANRLLYSSTWSFHLHNVIEALGWTVKSITRADICCDFVQFANGQLPTDFIHHYVRDSNSADTETYIRRGSNKFCVIGTKRMIAADGSTKIGKDTEIKTIESRFDYLRFGTRQSGVSAYLYNKSAELREQHAKPWIRQSWIDAGLIKAEYEDGEKEPDVYRLELSIQSKGMTFKVRNSTDSNFCEAETVRRLQASEFSTQLALEETFWAYQSRYFSFKVCTGQKYRKDMKELQLFEPEIAPQLKPCYLNVSVDHGVAERNAANCLKRLRDRALILSPAQQQTIQDAIEVLCDAKVIKRDDMIWDFAWKLDEIGDYNTTNPNRERLRKMVNDMSADILKCFRDPWLAQFVVEWEARQVLDRETLLLLKEAKDSMYFEDEF